VRETDPRRVPEPVLNRPKRTFGKATYVPDRNEWRLEVEPHVSMRAKQVFQKIRKSAAKILHMTATDENCRDLEWFMERFPLEVSDPDVLAEKARSFDRTADLAWSIIQGEYEVPDYEMVLPPRKYQSQAAQLCYATKGLLLADDLGLGKTVSALTLLANEGTLPALIVVPTHLQVHWKNQIAKFMPALEVHIIKKKKPYALDKTGRFPDVIISTYHKLGDWVDSLAGVVKTTVFDECQELRRGDSVKYESARLIADAATWVLGLSATPIYNYGVEFWNVLRVISPDALGTKEEFLREWCIRSYNEDKSRISDPKAFGTYLREHGLMLRRTKKEVGRELPPVVRIIEEVDSNTDVLKEADDAASQLATILLSQESSTSDRFTAAGQFDAKMRQVTGLAKAPFVAEFVRMLVEQNEEPVVLFGWHRDVYSIWMERLKDLNPVMFTGSESPKQKQDNLEAFIRGESKVLMMSLRSGSGVDGLQHVTSSVVIGELDWSPGALEQCVGRVSRDGQGNPVFVYYLMAREGADPIMIDVLGVKRQQIEGVRDPNADLVVPHQADPEHVKKLAEAYLKSRKR
jgi:SNF2 family DNA or RNA helicase